MTTPSTDQKTLANLAGKWHLNKPLSSTDVVPAILALQGTSLPIRKAISTASVTLRISQPQRNEYTIEQTATAASIPGTTERYILDGEWRTNHDAFFGEVRGRSRWVGLEEAESMMRHGVTAGEGDDDDDGRDVDDDDDDGRVILAEGGSTDGKWDALRIWGFEEIEGERRYTQRVKVRNRDGEEVEGKMVYDFIEG
ncbi:MAG: hypothetical protein Q9216_007026 [Gyalolechia sp. 2 TL-2023]